MKVISTGTTGFVGTNLIEYLKPSHEVHSMSVRYIPNQAFFLKDRCADSPCRKSA